VISPILANAYLNQLDWEVNERCELAPVMVRYADDFVILSRPGEGTALQERLKRWLTGRRLVLNEKKTRAGGYPAGGDSLLGLGTDLAPRATRTESSARGTPPQKSEEIASWNSGETESHYALAAGGRSDLGSESPTQRLGWVFSLWQQHPGYG